MAPADDSGLTPPRNLKITLEYDGERYVGWERQKNGLGIQEVVEEAIHSITGERTSINGSGRTDAGVHAEGQVGSFTLQHRMPTADLRRALNAVLPEDIAALEVEEVSLLFHARFSAKSKLYRYDVLDSRVPAPLLRRRCFQVKTALDIERMREAAAHLVGKHDFSAFCKDAARIGNCVRHLQRLEIDREDRLVVFRLASEGFLYNMVRIIVGTLVYVGSGRIEPADIPAIVASRDRKRAGFTAPPRGLSLVEVFY